MSKNNDDSSFNQLIEKDLSLLKNEGYKLVLFFDPEESKNDYDLYKNTLTRWATLWINPNNEEIVCALCERIKLNFY